MNSCQICEESSGRFIAGYKHILFIPAEAVLYKYYSVSQQRDVPIWVKQYAFLVDRNPYPAIGCYCWGLVSTMCSIFVARCFLQFSAFLSIVNFCSYQNLSNKYPHELCICCPRFTWNGSLSFEFVEPTIKESSWEGHLYSLFQWQTIILCCLFYSFYFPPPPPIWIIYVSRFQISDPISQVMNG